MDFWYNLIQSIAILCTLWLSYRAGKKRTKIFYIAVVSLGIILVASLWAEQVLEAKAKADEAPHLLMEDRTATPTVRADAWPGGRVSFHTFYLRPSSAVITFSNVIDTVVGFLYAGSGSLRKNRGQERVAISMDRKTIEWGASFLAPDAEILIAIYSKDSVEVIDSILNP